ncbi:unnamed protein product [Prorocentrum cordatum]|uniref:Uncharacterized protein n=1 Tax=Prorocentrum cordatum TaxID=2364126 RepID=A0ABN9Q115_9DINO|nr:unnamed protein product [Polarella glacialis]
MKLLFVVLLLTVNLSAGEEVSPIGKSIELISSLQAKIISEGEQSQKIYEGFSEWCEETNKNTAYEIKTSKTEIADLTATISQETALIESLTTKVEELSSKIKVDEQDLKAATDIRAAEAADFAAEKHELDSIIDTLQRAIGILEKHAGSALLQERGAAALTKALSLMVQAAGFSSADESRLTALVQESEDSFDDDAGAPDAATYESHSGNIVDTLRRLLEKAEVQLRNAQNREQKALFEFQQLAQSIEDAIRYANKELSEAKKGINAAGEKKATAEGDLEVTKADLAEDTRALEDLRTDCMTKAEDFEAETKSRGEELGALAQAKKIISETTGGAGAQAYPKKEESFVQVGSRSRHFEAVRLVRELARRQHAPSLAQLASRMAAVMDGGLGSEEDVFAKVKGLTGMIDRLEAEARADAKHKAYCDKELSYADKKKGDRDAEIEKLATSIDQMTSKSAQLQEEVALLQRELQDIAASQAEMDKIRREERHKFEVEKADLELGISGVKAALKVLRDYYAKSADHDTSSGEASTIIGLLEVVESDFEKGLSEATGEEENSQSEHDTLTKDNELSTTSKEQDVRYPIKESKDLDKAVAETSSDRDNVQTELEAIEKYLAKLHEQCDEKAEPYEETVKRRSEEISGLKQALDVLDGQASLLQESTQRSLRKVTRHVL